MSLGIYIHVPFCYSKCPYCDFYSIVGRVGKERTEDLKAKYIEALKAEIRFLSEKGKEKTVDTVYFGGGTPNFLEAKEVKTILDLLKSSFTYVDKPEITMEYNPKVRKGAEEAYLKGIIEAGVNRLSVGAQSFQEDTLKFLGRVHSPEDTDETVNLAKRAGFKNISLDLMFGIPGMSYESWIGSVEHAIRLNPEHISLYTLEFMEGTRFTKLLEEGKLKETEEILDRKMYHDALNMLKNAGFVQYEISNVAKTGFESKHNLKYWNMEEYLGLGPSAHSYFGGVRYSHDADLESYIADPISEKEYEKVQGKDEISEYIFTGLRKNAGIELAAFRKRFGKDIFEIYNKAEIESFVESGHVLLDDNCLKLTEMGFDISNRIMCLFV